MKYGCFFPDCENPHYGKGLCYRHWRQDYRGRLLNIHDPQIPTEPLRKYLEYLPTAPLASDAGVRDVDVVAVFERDTMSVYVADKIAVALNMHPSYIWGRAWEIGEEEE